MHLQFNTYVAIVASIIEFLVYPKLCWHIGLKPMGYKNNSVVGTQSHDLVLFIYVKPAKSTIFNCIISQ